MALIAGAEVEEDDAVGAATFQRGQAQRVAVEGGHHVEVGAADGDFTEGGDFEWSGERSGLDSWIIHGESLARIATKENPK